jgi:hypothetical protein
MRGMIGVATVVAAVAMVGLSAGTSGQEPPESPHPGTDPVPRVVRPMQGPSAGGMAGMVGIDPLAHLPLMLLRQREALGLDDAQVKKLAALHAEAERDLQSRRGRLSAIHDRLAAALEGDRLDLSAYGKAVRAEADSMVARRMEVARRAQKALDVLTPGQRSNALYGIRLLHVMGAGGPRGMGGVRVPGPHGGTGAGHGALHSGATPD